MNDLLLQLRTIVETNEVFRGGFLVAILSGLLLYARDIPRRVWGFIHRYSSIHLTLDDGCDSFLWLAKYCDEIFKKASFGDFFAVSTNSDITPSGIRWYRNGLCFYRFVLSKRDLENKTGGRSVEYSISISLYGVGKRKNLDKILNISKKKFGPKENELAIQRNNYDRWNYLGKLKQRDVKTIYSDNLPFILKDLDTFITSKEFYNARGIPYRRGYCLHGPAGTGKSTIAMAMARHLKRNLKILTIQSLGGKELLDLLSEDNNLILFEDIDAVKASKTRISNSDEENKELTHGGEDRVSFNSSGPSLSDLLNALDGVTTGENNIFIFTTNHIDRLDPALLRPGRIDCKIYMPHCSQSEFEKMCLAYYNKKCPSEHLVKENLAHASIQNKYLMNKDDFKSFLNQTTTVKELVIK